jgi:thiol-disulfide isomerase/thioredoxin
MSKNMIIGIVLAIVVIGGGFALVNNQANTETAMTQKNGAAMENDNAAMTNDAAAMEKEGVMMQKDDKMMADKSAASYVEYSKAALDGAADNRRVIYFYASWCPTCRPADADFKANTSKLPSDVTVVRVNYNDPDTDQEEKDLARKYGVTYQHTFVQIDGQGKEVTKWNGGQTEELLANLK